MLLCSSVPCEISQIVSYILEVRKIPGITAIYEVNILSILSWCDDWKRCLILDIDKEIRSWQERTALKRMLWWPSIDFYMFFLFISLFTFFTWYILMVFSPISHFLSDPLFYSLSVLCRKTQSYLHVHLGYSESYKTVRRTIKLKWFAINTYEDTKKRNQW